MCCNSSSNQRLGIPMTFVLVFYPFYWLILRTQLFAGPIVELLVVSAFRISNAAGWNSFVLRNICENVRKIWWKNLSDWKIVVRIHHKYNYHIRTEICCDHILCDFEPLQNNSLANKFQLQYFLLALSEPRKKIRGGSSQGADGGGGGKFFWLPLK